ncbi:MAG: acyltransferase family protein [Chloroflexota bacterium]
MTASEGPASRDDFRADVEGLRGLAVLAVVLFHAGLGGLIGGFVGVDVFFVISGFLITGLLLREHDRTGRIALLGFYARRARRLLPAAIVVLVATLVVALQLVAPLDRASVGLDGAAAALSVGNIRFALVAGDYFSSAAAPSPFLHFWSLAVEEQFYLVWPALILLVARGIHARRRVMIALIAVVAASFAANLIVTEAAANWAFYSLPTRAWELGLGGLLAAGSSALARIPGRIVGLTGWVGLAAILVATLTFDSSLAYPGSAALVPSLGAMVLLAGGSRPRGPGWFMSLVPLRYLGRISYSLYLVHWPILVLAPFVMGSEPDDLARAGLVGLSIAAAGVSWAIIETPFRKGLPQLAVRPGRTVSVGLAAVMVVVILAAGPFLGMAPGDTVAAAETVSVVMIDPTEEPWTDETTTPARSTQPTATPIGTPTATPAPSVTPGPTPASTAVDDIANKGALPANVKPALAEARSDEDRLRADGCLAFEPVAEPAKCVYGDKTSAFTVALVGDSHAAHWFPALERLAKHAGWRVVTFVKVACPFIGMPVRNTSLKREYRECADFNEATIARLKALKPGLTLVSMSRIAIHPMSDDDDTVAAKGAAIGRMVARIPGKTALIVDTPYAGRDVPGCLSSHPDDIGACAISRATAFTDHLGGVERVAAKATGAGLINLTDRVCVGEGRCPVVVNGLIVYRDIAHLTATFSRSLAPALGVAIAAVLAD